MFTDILHARYCSRECQKADWKKHKPRCKMNQAYASALGNITMAPPSGLLDGVSLTQYSERLTEWIDVWSATMAEAAIHAMQLPDDIKRCREHILHLQVAGRPESEHHGNPKLFFMISAVRVVTLDYASTINGELSVTRSMHAFVHSLNASQQNPGEVVSVT